MALKARRVRWWLVWEEEYADEGSHEILATSASAAKRKYREVTGDDTALLRAARLTPELARIRNENEAAARRLARGGR